MRVLGIDPGTAITGYGVVEERGSALDAMAFGALATEPGPAGRRLLEIFRGVETLLERYRPDALAVEQVFFNRNVRTALAVGHARGVVLLAAARAGLEVFEFTPLEVKMAVTGYGRADKRQVQAMVRAILGLEEEPRPDDAADALAVAVCCLHARPLARRLEEEGR